jgi:hypothetical protein
MRMTYVGIDVSKATFCGGLFPCQGQQDQRV